MNLTLQSLFVTLFLVASTVLAQETQLFPGYRHVDPTGLINSTSATSSVVLATDQDFAPWSFVGSDGTAQGLSVDLVRAACFEAQVNCDIRPLPFSELLPSLRSGAVGGVVSGFAQDQALAKEFALTRPYFRSSARFVMRNGTPIPKPDIRSLAGLRVGYVSNTSHARFLESFYARSALTPYDSSAAMLEALRTGQLDAAFGDSIHLAFWLNGQSARGCCAVLGKALLHSATFSRSLGFTFRRDDPGLRTRIDQALDRLEANGSIAQIFARYLPTSVW